MNNTYRIILQNNTGEYENTEPMASEMTSGDIPHNTEPKTVNKGTTKTKRGQIGTAITTGVLLSAGKQGADLVLSNVGMITGDSLKQKKVNNALKMAGYATALATGLATMNAPLLIGTAVSAGVEATTYAINESHRQKWEAINIEKEMQYRNLVTAGYGRKR